MKSVLITGGHFAPGLAAIPCLKEKGLSLFWVGEKTAVSGTKVKTIESRILPDMGVPFYALTTAKFSRNNPLLFIFNLWKLPVGFLQSLVFLFQIKPNAILSFGSYVSLPVCFAGWLMRVPVVIHEQTAASGLANRLVAKFAKVVAVSFQESLKDFPSDRTVLTGNLVREDFYRIAAQRKKRRKNESPVLYITGGSRGSQVINRAVFAVLDTLLQKFVVFHQTGSLDIERAKEKKSNLPRELSKNYLPNEFLTPKEVEERYLKADLIVSRSGANTVSETAICGIPAIFIPLSHAGSDEQTKNAELLKGIGLAEILPQGKLSGKSLEKMITEMWKKIGVYQKNASRAANLVPRSAAEKLSELVEQAVYARL